jgi:uncharacterized protein YjiS (DUF1127 family)
MVMSMTRTAEEREQVDGGALATAAAALKRLGAAYISWRMEQSAMAELSFMSERELADVGLSRSDITVAVRSGKARIRGESCESC